MSDRLHTEFLDFDMYSYFYSLVKQIPEGMISTYGALADALGDHVAARACGYMLSINPNPGEIPSHRVIRSDGTLGKYSHSLGIESKASRLREEGVQTTKDNVVDVADRLFTDFVSDYPLKKMQEEQLELSKSIVLEDGYDLSRIAAVDVSYDDHFGYASMVIYEGEEYTERKFIDAIRFPYIPGYLSYREYKYIERLAKGFDGLLLIDGNGILHPRHFGLASFAGVLLDTATVGVAKSLLLGKEANGWIEDKGSRIGYRLNKKTIISPGNRISLASSVREITMLFDRMYPEILKIADKNTVRIRKERNE